MPETGAVYKEKRYQQHWNKECNKHFPSGEINLPARLVQVEMIQRMLQINCKKLGKFPLCMQLAFHNVHEVFILRVFSIEFEFQIYESTWSCTPISIQCMVDLRLRLSNFPIVEYENPYFSLHIFHILVMVFEFTKIVTCFTSLGPESDAEILNIFCRIYSHSSHHFGNGK